MTSVEISKSGDGPPENDVARLEMTIRPGVTFPDWSAISSPQARDALNAILEVFGVARCWESYGAEEDLVRRAILEGYARDGRAPAVSSLADETDLSEEAVRSNLASLQARDLIVLDEDNGRVTGAYPLTDRTTGHRGRLGENGTEAQSVNAMCAIDALGAGDMYGRNTVVDSSCRSCGRTIRIETRDSGTALDTVSPGTAIVWSGMAYEDGCAATSLCTVIAFFCSEGCAEDWRRDEAPETKGYRLSMDEALQAGRAIFNPMLKPAT